MNLIVLILTLLLGGEPPLVLTPVEWNLGRIERSGGIVTTEVVVENMSGREAEIAIISTCECLWITPTKLQLAPGESAHIELTFDPIEEPGSVQKDIIIRTNLDRLPKALYLVYGEVTGDAPEAGTADAETGETAEAAAEGTHQQAGSLEDSLPEERPPQDSPPLERLPVDFYASPGCRSCQRLLRRTIPRIERRTGIPIAVIEHNILDAQEYAAYLEILREAGQEERAYPALVVGRTVLQSETSIEQQLEDLLTGRSPPAVSDSAVTQAPASRLALIPILAAGLLDGINPCAFTTLVFLISALAVAGRSRIQVLQIGLFFSAAVFVTYLMIGLGFFQAIRLASAFPIVAAVIRWILVAVLLAFAALSVYDYFQIRFGRTDKVMLQLPQPIKRRLHRDIKSRTRSAALIASSLVLGFLVSIFELACTGQVYFPTLVYLHQVRREVGSFSYLLLYNFAFILPLLIVFALSYWGISSQRLSRWVQGSMKPVKLLLAGLFLALALLTALT
jgi:cytochrome c biogenesis protein CcdA